MNRPVRINVIFCFFLSLLTVAVFWGILGNDFINYDDFQYVTGNRHVTSGLSIKNVIWAFTSGYAGNWHPVTWISHMVDIELFDMNPQGHHLMNLLIHTANTCLLFLFLNKISGAVWRSVIVAALFAIHPLHVESVAWVAERKDVLSTCFAMLTLLVYTWYVQKHSLWRYLALCGLYTLGLMSKPMLVTLPFVLLLLDYWPFQRFVHVSVETGDGHKDTDDKRLPLSKLFMEKMPLFALAILSSCITIYVQKGEALHTLEMTPLSFRIANVLFAYVRYLGKTLWPSNLSVLYPLPQTTPLLMGILSGMSLLLITWGTYALSHRRPYLLFGWFWFLGTLVPVIGFVQVGLQSMADRYTYFPLIGIFIMIVWGVADLTVHRPFWRIPLVLSTAGILTVYCAVTWSYERCWENSTTLSTHVVAVTPDSYYAHYMLGKALYEDNKFNNALVQYNMASQLNPLFADAYIDRGIIHAKLGNQAEAINNFAKALTLKPESPYVHYNLAVALHSQYKLAEALTHYHEVVRLDPENIGAQYNLGVIFMGLKKWDEAISRFTEVMQLEPEHEDARKNLQMCMQRKVNRDKDANN